MRDVCAFHGGVPGLTLEQPFMSELLAFVFYSDLHLSSFLPVFCAPPAQIASLFRDEQGQGCVNSCLLCLGTARGGLNATSGMWQALKAGSPAISGGSLSCCWRFLAFLKCSTNSAGGSWSPASQEKVMVHRVNSEILNNVLFCTLTLQCWDIWGL